MRYRAAKLLANDDAVAFGKMSYAVRMKAELAAKTAYYSNADSNSTKKKYKTKKGMVDRIIEKKRQEMIKKLEGEKNKA